MLDEMRVNDVQLNASDIRQLENADEIAHVFVVSSTGHYPIAWIEIMYGAAGKAGQAKCKAILSEFDMEYLT